MILRRLWRLGLPVSLQKIEDMVSGLYATDTAIIHCFLCLNYTSLIAKSLSSSTFKAGDSLWPPTDAPQELYTDDKCSTRPLHCWGEGKPFLESKRGGSCEIGLTKSLCRQWRGLAGGRMQLPQLDASHDAEVNTTACTHGCCRHMRLFLQGECCSECFTSPQDSSRSMLGISGLQNAARKGRGLLSKEGVRFAFPIIHCHYDLP